MEPLGFPAPFLIAIILFIILAISALHATLFGLSSVIYSMLCKTSNNVLAKSLCFAAFHTAAELILTLSEKLDFPGFPWAVTYISQGAFISGIQSASIFGAYFITFIIVLFNALIAHALFCSPLKRNLCIFLAIVIFTGNLIFGTLYIKHDKNTESIDAVIYQDNNSSYDKWAKLSVDTFDEFRNDITSYFSENPKADIVVLSETVFTTLFNTNIGKSSINGRYIQDGLIALSKDLGCTIVCGAFTEQNEERYNSIYLFENGKMHNNIYNKHTLVPFGEYIPGKLTHTFPFLENFNLGGKPLTKGAEHHVFKTDKLNIGALICYDSLFYENAAESTKNAAEIIVMSTNDSWYNDSAAVYQHFAHARFRAVETGRSIVRSAATGISGIIDSHGRTVIHGKLLQKDIVAGKATVRNNITPFTRYGYIYFYILLIISSIYTAACCFYKKLPIRRKYNEFQSKNNFTA
ncbi:MAG: apolipoprotein N-acyltransferase [Clostridia bacterium]|nr:apolipoprotein N-acyltransferase [Clostridia bacterium]